MQRFTKRPTRENRKAQQRCFDSILDFSFTHHTSVKKNGRPYIYVWKQGIQKQFHVNTGQSWPVSGNSAHHVAIRGGEGGRGEFVTPSVLNPDTKWKESKSYVYGAVHHLDSWVKRKPTWCHLFYYFIQCSFNAQHVSAVNATIFRSLRLIGCYFMGCICKK